MNIHPLLPEDWWEGPLQEVVSINPASLGSWTPPTFTFRYIDIASVGGGRIHWDRVTTQRFATAPSRARRVVQPGDCLLCTVRPGLLAHAFVEDRADPLVCSTGFAVLRSSGRIQPRYLFHVLFSAPFTSQLCRLETGTNYPAVGDREVRRVPIRVPPRAEQDQIIEILDSLDTTLCCTATLLDKLKQVGDGLLRDLLNRTGWRQCPLGEVADIHTGVTLGRKIDGPDTAEYPYLRVANVQDGHFDLQDIRQVRILKEELGQYLLQPGDVLLTEGGDYDKLGRGAVWGGEITPCLHQNHIFRVRVNRDILLPEYLALVVGSSIGKGYFLRSSKRTTTLASINSTQLKEFQFPCPSLADQQRVVQVMQAVQDRLHVEQVYQAKVRLQKRGLMNDLLTGRVRVSLSRQVS